MIKWRVEVLVGPDWVEAHYGDDHDEAANVCRSWFAKGYRVRCEWVRS